MDALPEILAARAFRAARLDFITWMGAALENFGYLKKKICKVRRCNIFLKPLIESHSYFHPPLFLKPLSFGIDLDLGN